MLVLAADEVLLEDVVEDAFDVVLETLAVVAEDELVEEGGGGGRLSLPVEAQSPTVD